MSWVFRKASETDCKEIADLVNSAYRGESSRAGWTTEADLLGGLRADAELIRENIQRPNSAMLTAIDSEGVIVGCVHLEKRSDSKCYLGMLAVKPIGQGSGLGNALIAASEKFARENYDSSVIEMSVITVREDLIKWYERRGYSRTGRLIPFPVHPKFGVLKVESLEMEILEKQI